MLSASSYKTPSVEEILHALQTREGGAWTEAEMLAKFNLTPSNLQTLRNNFLVVSWPDQQGQLHYPKWQFADTGALLPGVQEVLRTFKSQDTWRIMSYFLGARRQFQGLCALFLLRKNKVTEVLAHAKLHYEENTW